MLSGLLRAHRSVRQFQPEPIARMVIDEVLADAIAGSSSAGNLTPFSLVLTQDPERKQTLHQLHFEQPMVQQAPLVITFCADQWRNRQWLARRGARDNFDNFRGFVDALIDTIIVSQSVCLGFEAKGYGICYMGSTLSSCREIAELLALPPGCLPVTSIVVGRPAESSAPRDRLPLGAYVHDETYHRLSGDEIDTLYREREQRGWARYRSLGDDFVREMDALGITSLAQFYTSDIKYPPASYQATSRELLDLLQAYDFMRHQAGTAAA
jgi:nitroreductase